MPRLVNPPPGAIFSKKWVNEGFESFLMRTPPILGALNRKNMPLESKDLLFGYFLSKGVCRYLVSRLVKSGKPPPPAGGHFLEKMGK